jgi:MFS family permease
VLSFGLSALILTRLPSLEPGAKVSGQGSPIQSPSDEVNATSDGSEEKQKEARKLLPALKEMPQLQLLFALTFLAISVIVGFDVLAPVFFRDILNVSEAFFGQSIGLVGLGTLFTSLGLMLRKGNGRPWLDVIAGVLLLGIIPLAMAVATLPELQAQARWLVLAASLIGGIGNGLIVVQVGTLLQLLSPADLLGRMGGIFQSTAVGGQLTGILVTPLLVPGLVSMGVYFGLSSMALLLVMLLTSMVLRRTGHLVPERSIAGEVSHGD